jgi:hypothetical protein
MPAIQAYKANGKIIPVSEAKIAKVYQCPWTNDLFSTKKAYLKHLKDLRENRMHKRARRNILDRKFATFYNQPTFKDIIEWIETNPEFFFDNLIQHGHTGWATRRAHIRSEYWIKIHYLDLTYSQQVSNSHSAPRGKKTNWCGSKDKEGIPHHYPGWQGRISFQTSHDLGFGSDTFRGTGIHTGTGGGGTNNTYSYECKMFAEDWPGLAAALSHEMLVDDVSITGSIKKFTYGKRDY